MSKPNHSLKAETQQMQNPRNNNGMRIEREVIFTFKNHPSKDSCRFVNKMKDWFDNGVINTKASLF